MIAPPRLRTCGRPWRASRLNHSTNATPAGRSCPRAVKEAHVALTPGGDFGGADMASHVRLSHAASRAGLVEGLTRPAAFVDSVRSAGGQRSRA